MNIHEIQSTRQKERQKSDLQHLDDTFYQETAAYLEELYEERKEVAAAADDPFSSTEVQHLTDTIETVEQTVETLYERRMGKIVKQASFAAAGLPANADATTTEEQQLFESLVDELESNRESVLSMLAYDPTDSSSPSGDTGDSSKAVSEGVDSDAVAQATAGGGDGRTAQADGGVATTSPSEGEGMAAAAVMGSGSPAEGEEAGTGSDAGAGEDEDDGWDVPRQTVQITTDVGEIFGVDEREYYLYEDDVVTLPEANASVLVEKDAAEALD